MRSNVITAVAVDCWDWLPTGEVNFAFIGIHKSNLYMSEKSIVSLQPYESWVQHRWVGFSGLCSARGQPRSLLKTESSVMSSTARPLLKPMCVASLDALSCGAAQGPATLLKLFKPQTFIITSLNIMALGLPRKTIIW